MFYLPMDALPPHTATNVPTWVEQPDGSITLTLSNSSLRLKKIGTSFTLVITINNSSKFYKLTSEDLSSAKEIAVMTLKEIVNNLNQDIALLSNIY